jgi:hypothetical protein
MTGPSSRRRGSRHHHLHTHLRATISHWKLHRGIDTKKNISPTVHEVYMCWELVYNAIAGRQCLATFYFSLNLCHNFFKALFLHLFTRCSIKKRELTEVLLPLGGLLPGSEKGVAAFPLQFATLGYSRCNV